MTHPKTGIDARQDILVLVVEDEPIQRMEMVALIEEAGFDVVECFDADQAVAILEERTDIRLVLSDIDMPGSMNGLKLAACIRERWPPIHLVLTSAGRPPRKEDLPERAVFLPKPINYDRTISVLTDLAVTATA